jgi:hypothetical protein
MGCLVLLLILFVIFWVRRKQRKRRVSTLAFRGSQMLRNPSTRTGQFNTAAANRSPQGLCPPLLQPNVTAHATNTNAGDHSDADENEKPSMGDGPTLPTLDLLDTTSNRTYRNQELQPMSMFSPSGLSAISCSTYPGIEEGYQGFQRYLFTVIDEKPHLDEESSPSPSPPPAPPITPIASAVSSTEGHTSAVLPGGPLNERPLAFLSTDYYKPQLASPAGNSANRLSTQSLTPTRKAALLRECSLLRRQMAQMQTDMTASNEAAAAEMMRLREQILLLTQQMEEDRIALGDEPPPAYTRSSRDGSRPSTANTSRR